MASASCGCEQVQQRLIIINVTDVIVLCRSKGDVREREMKERDGRSDRRAREPIERNDLQTAMHAQAAALLPPFSLSFSRCVCACVCVPEC